MKRRKYRLPIPQHEFGFTPDAFNLMAETGLDGERLPANAPRPTATAAWPRPPRPHFLPPTPHTTMNDNPFGPIIYAYTRAQAIADGVQVDITTTAQEAGIRFPVFITRTAFALYVTVPPDVTGQDEAGRLWDVIQSS